MPTIKYILGFYDCSIKKLMVLMQFKVVAFLSDVNKLNKDVKKPSQEIKYYWHIIDPVAHQNSIKQVSTAAPPLDWPYQPSSPSSDRK